MKTIVLLLALASAAFADEYTPVDWLEVTANPEVGIYSTEDGGRKVKVGSYALTGGAGCVVVGGFTINNARYSIRTSKWQMRKGEDSAWSDVAGTGHANGGVCGLTPDVPPGEYRVVAEVKVDGVMGKYASRSSIVIAGGPRTAVEAVTWGSLKSKTTR